MDALNIKLQAKEKLNYDWSSNKWWKFAIIEIIVLAVNYVINGLFPRFINIPIYDFVNKTTQNNSASIIDSLFMLFLNPVLIFAISKTALDVVYDREYNYTIVFSGFKLYLQLIWLNFINSLIVILYTFLLIVPGIMKLLEYSMCYYILAEDNTLTATDARFKSSELMYGHKMELFKLFMSFIWWWILCCLTAGILFIWIVPYYETSKAIFYQKIKLENFNREN